MTDSPIALISGAAQGIGLACAEALAEDGYKVILADVKDMVVSEGERLGGAGYVCDFGDVDAIHNLFERSVVTQLAPIVHAAIAHVHTDKQLAVALFVPA